MPNGRSRYVHWTGYRAFTVNRYPCIVIEGCESQSRIRWGAFRHGDSFFGWQGAQGTAVGPWMIEDHGNDEEVWFQSQT
jgi:methyl coenzyme M reductase alpha subunit